MSIQSTVPATKWSEVRKRRLNILGPRVITGAAGEIIVALTDRREGISRVIQNCGTATVKYAVNTNPNAEEFHGILAGCASQDDGLGSVLDCSNYRGEVRIWSADAYRVCVFEALQG